MSAIYRRELHSYFTSPIGWLLVAFLLVMNSFYFTAYNLNGGYSNYGLVLYNILIVLLLFCPLLTMRSFSEERRQKTDQLITLMRKDFRCRNVHVRLMQQAVWFMYTALVLSSVMKEVKLVQMLH